jgi:hypothetical protein
MDTRITTQQQELLETVSNVGLIHKKLNELCTQYEKLSGFPDLQKIQSNLIVKLLYLSAQHLAKAHELELAIQQDNLIQQRITNIQPLCDEFEANPRKASSESRKAFYESEALKIYLDPAASKEDKLTAISNATGALATLEKILPPTEVANIKHDIKEMQNKRNAIQAEVIRTPPETAKTTPALTHDELIKKIDTYIDTRQLNDRIIRIPGESFLVTATRREAELDVERNQLKELACNLQNPKYSSTKNTYDTLAFLDPSLKNIDRKIKNEATTEPQPRSIGIVGPPQLQTNKASANPMSEYDKRVVSEFTTAVKNFRDNPTQENANIVKEMIHPDCIQGDKEKEKNFAVLKEYVGKAVYGKATSLPLAEILIEIDKTVSTTPRPR